MPSLAFCSESPFVPDAHWSVNPDDYLNNIPNVTFGSIYTSDGFLSKGNPFRVSYLDTLYNGKCQLLESDLDMAAATYVSLHALHEEVLNSNGLLVHILNPGILLVCLKHLGDLAHKIYHYIRR